MRRLDPIPALKVHLARILVERLDGWSQVNAAAFMGTDQPRMSDLRNGRLDRISLEQLIRFTSRLFGDVTLQITWVPRNFRQRPGTGIPGVGGREPPLPRSLWKVGRP